MGDPATILLFPRPLRVVVLPDDVPTRTTLDPALVGHAGRTYRLADLLACLSPAKLSEMEAMMPRTWQATWDEVLRRWPALAEEIVAGCQSS